MVPLIQKIDDMMLSHLDSRIDKWAKLFNVSNQTKVLGQNKLEMKELVCKHLVTLRRYEGLFETSGDERVHGSDRITFIKCM